MPVTSVLMFCMVPHRSLSPCCAFGIKRPADVQIANIIRARLPAWPTNPAEIVPPPPHRFAQSGQSEGIAKFAALVDFVQCAGSRPDSTPTRSVICGYDILLTIPRLPRQPAPLTLSRGKCIRANSSVIQTMGACCHLCKPEKRTQGHDPAYGYAQPYLREYSDTRTSRTQASRHARPQKVSLSNQNHAPFPHFPPRTCI